MQQVENYKIIPLNRSKDLTTYSNEKFTILYRTEKPKELVCEEAFWLVQCNNCRKYFIKRASAIRKGKFICDCELDLTGQRFGRWTVLYKTSYKKNYERSILWHCKCDCGIEKDVTASNLRNGKSQSCGCLNRENVAKAAKKRLNDLTGQRFGYWTVLYRDKNNDRNATMWHCKCICGIEKDITASSLIRGMTKSCGCQKGKFISNYFLQDLTGQKYGKLTVLYLSDIRKNNRTTWHCKCDCGNETDVQASLLKKGMVSSCGCLKGSKNNMLIENMLKNNNIIYQKQYNPFQKYRFDFFIENKYIIEFDGSQHFFWHNGSTWNNEENFYITRKHDLIKNKYCFDNNIPLIRIPYDVEYTIDDLKLETTRFLLTPENEKEYYESRA